MSVIKRIGPATLGTSAADVYHPAGPEELRLIHVSNRTSSPAKLSLWVGATGATAAGTDLFIGRTIAAFDTFSWPFLVKMTTADFLVGQSDTAAALTIVVTAAQVGV